MSFVCVCCSFAVRGIAASQPVAVGVTCCGFRPLFKVGDGGGEKSVSEKSSRAMNCVLLQFVTPRGGNLRDTTKNLGCVCQCVMVDCLISRLSDEKRAGSAEYMPLVSQHSPCVGNVCYYFVLFLFDASDGI